MWDQVFWFVFFFFSPPLVAGKTVWLGSILMCRFDCFSVKQHSPAHTCIKGVSVRPGELLADILTCDCRINTDGLDASSNGSLPFSVSQPAE